MEVKMHDSWKKELAPEYEKDYFLKLTSFVREEYRTGTCFPPGKLVFSAFDHCPFDKVKVVIIGQDPYHGPGQANGLCFSVNPGIAVPPSLLNIYKEIRSDLGIEPPSSGDLSRWADQGVLLLNAVLTVRAHQPASHKGKGWELFTDAVIRAINDHRQGIVFMLWGAYAQKKGAMIDTGKHMVLKAPHPSPLSAYQGFLGCKHFSQANDWLRKIGQKPIEW